MATRRGGSGDPKKESFLEAAGAVIGVCAFLFGFIWFLGSHKIVYYFTPLLRWLGTPWFVADKGKWDAINEAFVFFRNAPRSIPLANFLSYANACLLPLAILLSVCAAVYLLVRLTSKSSGGDLRRKLEPMRLATEIAKTFPAILPVLHLGPDLVANKLPLWRRQTFPEDIWQNEKVGGRPLAVGAKLFRERVETYFRGGEVKDGPHQKRGDKRWSKMLGYQVVDLIVDAPKQKTICFPDRFSPQGKVLFGLLCAHAFGGREGKLDYQKACDQLNRTCAGQANGLPNLTVAQWLYSKYRMHPDAKKLFAVHHWEYTYLFSLFFKAKKNGKATHTDFIWLKPLDRIFFYALNTVGRAVPHAEAGSVFAVFDYEVKCARYNRLPLRMRKDGTLEANICVYCAVEGLNQEFNRYLGGTDDNDDWWKNLGTWDAAEKMRLQQESMKVEMKALNDAQKIIDALPAQPDTPFDTAMNAKREAEEAEETARLGKALGGVGGTSGGPELF